VVGDRKQSIYTFRGADPESFDAFSRMVVEHGGAEEQLTVSRRSSPELIAAVNSLGEWLFAERYEALAADDEAGAGKALGRPGMTQIQAPDDRRGAARAIEEARVVASVLRSRLRHGGAAGDYAILLASMSYAPVYAAALNGVGVPAVLGAGTGFYEQPEIIDMVSLMAWLASASERLAAAVALRSPLCGLSEAALLRLFVGGREHNIDALRSGRCDPSRAPAQDAGSMARLNAVLPELVAAAQVMDPVELLEYIDRLLDVRATTLALDGGEQRSANLDRLWELAQSFAANGRGGVARFAREQAAKIRVEHKEPLVAIPAAARRAVTILTVHQAKGLQYSVVVLCDLHHGERSARPVLRYGRGHGVVFSPQVRGSAIKSERYHAVELAAREQKDAEQKRLLYVAVTRAEREVLLVGGATGEKRGFARLLQPWLAGVAGHLVAREGTPPALSVVDAVESPVQGAGELADTLMAASEARPAPVGTRFVLSVTGLETHVQCLRRGLFVHALGLSEPGFGERTLRWPTDDEREPPLDPRARGRLAHAVLAALPGLDGGEPEAFVEEQLRLLGHDPRDSRLAEVREDTLVFLRSPLGRRLAAMDAGERRHELPFTIDVKAPPYTAVLHGQIDLLYWDKDIPVIVDYKHAKAEGAGPAAHAIQLDAYALAVERLCGATGDITARLVFLRERGEPLVRVVTPQMRADLIRATGEVVAAMAIRRQMSDPWPGQPRTRCEALRCGFVFRCHGKKSAPAQMDLFSSEAGGVAG
ncbi:MAG: PD-(D/E)XK nuclease family protein, partial [Deltaproteobacteria bacterium]|nr:PD-(D/E)XK nuclease family protein [Deltaproteobacteria bacterium]